MSYDGYLAIAGVYDKLNKEIDYSKLGTIYHSIMEKIKFESMSFMECKKEIPKIINSFKQQLADNEVIDEKQIETAVYNLGEFLRSSDKVYKEICPKAFGCTSDDSRSR